MVSAHVVEPHAPGPVRVGEPDGEAGGAVGLQLPLHRDGRACPGWSRGRSRPPGPAVGGEFQRRDVPGDGALGSCGSRSGARAAANAPGRQRRSRPEVNVDPSWAGRPLGASSTVRPRMPSVRLAHRVRRR